MADQGADPTARERISPPHFVYVLRCADDSLYAGYTTDLARRLAQHQSGKGAKYTRSHRPVTLLAHWRYADRGAALRAERRFKRLDRARKLEVVARPDSFGDTTPFGSSAAEESGD